MNAVVEASEPSSEDPSLDNGWPHRARTAQTPPPLGPKASRLQARRRQGAAACQASRTTAREGRLATADAAVTFTLEPCGDGSLYLERIQRRPIGMHLTLSMRFASRDEFARWLEVEPLRLDDPGLHDRLRRFGEEHFDATR